MTDRPYVEALTRRLREIQSATLAARPRDPRVIVTGDVQEALYPVVLAHLAGAGLSDLSREDLAIWRWLCGWDPETIGRLVAMVELAHERGAQ